VRRHRYCGHAVVEWALCIPVLVVLLAFVFGFLFVLLRQIQLEDVCQRAAETLAHSDAPDAATLEQEALRFVGARAAFCFSLKLDRHVLVEAPTPGPARRPSMEVVGVELGRSLALLKSVRLRAYARAARVR
jgi:hypothetical protein